jgi:hypothetical protein
METDFTSFSRTIYLDYLGNILFMKVITEKGNEIIILFFVAQGY